jgi:hypothetical protein
VKWNRNSKGINIAWWGISQSATTLFRNPFLWVPAAYYGHFLKGENLNLLQGTSHIPEESSKSIQLNLSHTIKTTTENTIIKQTVTVYIDTNGRVA